MRETTGIGSDFQLSSRLMTRAMRLSAVALGLGLVLFSGPLHAQDADEEDDDRTFERKIIDNVMSGIGGRKLEDGTINYRERSPLVVPSKIALPPPQSGKAKLAPNWPKDPDEAQRKAARAAAKQKLPTPEESARPLMPSELNQRTPAGSSSASNDSQPGGNNSNTPPVLMPSELGFTGGLFSNPFSSKKAESETFTKEPERTELTQPPSGYQTPSTTYAYGTGNQKMTPKETCDQASGKCETKWVFQ